MRLFGNLVVRTISIILGYAFAVMAAGLFLSFGFFREVFGGSFDAAHGEYVFEGVSIGLVSIYLSAVIAWIAALPAAIAIAITEMMRWQSATILSLIHI